MLGSLRKIWPWKETIMTFIDRHGKEIPSVQINMLPPDLNHEVGLALLFAVIGFFVVVGMNYWQLKKH